MSKEEDDSFRFIGIDIKKVKDGIEISMEGYAESLDEIEIREDRSDETLTREELKLLRNYVRKLKWLATNKISDIGIYTLDLAKKQKKASLKDLRSVNRVLTKVHEKENKVMF